MDYAKSAPPDGLQRDLAGQLGRPADLEEVVLLANLAELGQVPGIGETQHFLQISSKK